MISCEHGGNQVPEQYQELFEGADEALQSHRGWDPGALDIAAQLAERLPAHLFFETTTRLLIEMNRSLDNPALFSAFSNELDDAGKAKLIAEYHHPYWQSIENKILELDTCVLHLSVHSFTPVWEGVSRAVDIGLLFDPERSRELEYCIQLKLELALRLPGFNIRFNEPYKGTDDGLTTTLRKKFPGNEYLGIELEINQKFVDTPQFITVQQALLESVRVSL